MKKSAIQVGVTYTIARSVKDLDLDLPIQAKVVGEPVQYVKAYSSLDGRWMVPVESDLDLEMLVHRRWAVRQSGVGHRYLLLTSKVIETLA